MDILILQNQINRNDGVRNTILRIRRRLLRDLSNPFEVPENEFISLYRLSKASVRSLIEDMRPLLPVPRRRTAIPVEFKVLSALNFFAAGSYQKRVGQDYLTCMSQSTISIVLHEVVDALNILMGDWLKFPTENEEIQDIKEEYWEHTRFPGVIGAIDGTHVAIVSPEVHREHLYINRKLYHSLNVLIVCDYNGKILTVNASHGGRTHDARVWRASIVSNHLHEKYLQGRQNSWLLGDSAYPLKPYLMTPKLRAPEGSPSARYTQHHVQSRCSVERCIGVLKGRWRCLRKERVLHYSPEFAGRIVNACCVLHNIALRWRLPEVQLHFDEIDRLCPEPYQNVEIVNGTETRERIIQNYYTHRIYI